MGFTQCLIIRCESGQTLPGWAMGAKVARKKSVVGLRPNLK
jgi:hypothetical protein